MEIMKVRPHSPSPMSGLARSASAAHARPHHRTASWRISHRRPPSPLPPQRIITSIPTQERSNPLDNNAHPSCRWRCGSRCPIPRTCRHVFDYDCERQTIMVCNPKYRTCSDFTRRLMWAFMLLIFFGNAKLKAECFSINILHVLL